MQDEREKDPAFVSDAYAECYPAFHEFGNTVVDSDEEDMSHMDKKGVRISTMFFLGCCNDGTTPWVSACDGSSTGLAHSTRHS